MSRASLNLHEYDESRLCLTRLLEIQEDELAKLSQTSQSLSDGNDEKNSLENVNRNIAVTKQQMKKVEIAKRKYKVESEYRT